MKIEYMQLALEEAKKAAQEDEVPIGCVIVDPKTDTVIVKTHNASEKVNCLKHAELLAIEKATEKLNSNRLWGMDLYVTLEPCTMCAAGISFARIANLYFGAFDQKGGAVVNGVKFFASPTCHHHPNIEGGIMEPECSQILKDFFKTKR